MKNSLFVLSIIALTGCQSVEPWERGILAREEMQWQASTMEARFRQQMFNSKEASVDLRRILSHFRLSFA
ncbi:DUF4266 domain-containing protein [Porticoccus sp.]|uniref:DUF4266 domain-containing protein n=1 Tax=Porticoccus sp. TaxID=2024853 RepID=UPI003F69FB98